MCITDIHILFFLMSHDILGYKYYDSTVNLLFTVNWYYHDGILAMDTIIATVDSLRADPSVNGCQF